MRETQVDPTAVDAVLTASRSMVAVATRSLGAAAEETTIAQYRALVVLASRGPRRIVDLAEALDVAPSTAGRMCDRLVRKGLVRRHRARGDRRVVVVSVTPAGRQVVDDATSRRRELIADILARLPASGQRAVAQALRAFADAAGEVPDDQWPSAVPTLRVPRRAPGHPFSNAIRNCSATARRSSGEGGGEQPGHDAGGGVAASRPGRHVPARPAGGGGRRARRGGVPVPDLLLHLAGDRAQRVRAGRVRRQRPPAVARPGLLRGHPGRSAGCCTGR